LTFGRYWSNLRKLIVHSALGFTNHYIISIMPNKNSAKKALRQTKTHALQNKAKREALRTAVKNVTKAKTVGEAMKLVVAAQQALDKAAKIGVIKKNTASRRLSRLMAKVHALKK